MLQEQKAGWYELLSITDTHLFEKKNRESYAGKKTGSKMPFEIFLKTIHAEKFENLFKSGK